jgi:benzodiazapine receptor
LTPARHWPVLIGFLVLCFIVAGIGGAVTAPNIPTWYAGLAKPSFQPPNWLFAPVWTALYAVMALAAWMVWRAAGPSRRAAPIGLFLLQLALNAIWSPLFFGMHLPLPALIDIGLLWLAIAATIVAFRRVSSVAGLLLLPYLAWVTFAGALNLAIWRLNG